MLSLTKLEIEDQLTSGGILIELSSLFAFDQNPWSNSFWKPFYAQQICTEQTCKILLIQTRSPKIFPNLQKIRLSYNYAKGKGALTTETIKEKSMFQAKALRRDLVGPSLIPKEGPSLETSIFPLSFQVVREPLPFVYH